MEKLKKIWIKIFPYIKNKYILTFLVFLIWILFFDKNNLLERARNLKQLKQLEKDKIYYQERIEKDAARLEQLKTDKENLEKFAREQYYMKKENEDIFVIVEEE